MNDLLRKISFGLLLLIVLAGSASAQNRIGTLNLKKVFDDYYKTKQAKAVIDERKADKEKEFKVMVDDYKKAKDTYQTMLSDANNQALSQDERDKRKKSAEEKFKQLKLSEENIQEFQRREETTLREQNARLISNLVGDIRNVVNTKAKAASYTMVVDVSAEGITTTPFVLYTNNENDMTADVLKELNLGAPPETAAPEIKKEEKKDDKKKK
jgi:outer membrane protein